MAAWYISSVAWTAIPQWAALTTYVVGDIRRGLAVPAITAEHVFRVSAITTGISGAAEPTWTTTNNGNTTDAGVTWTCVSGQSAFGWTAAAGSDQTLESSRFAAGDQVFFSSDHSQSSAGILFSGGTNTYAPVQRISVNRAGSVPPVAADILPGATIAMTSGPTFDRLSYWEGFTLSSTAGIIFNSGQQKGYVFRNCALSSTGISTANPVKVTLDNTTLQFAAVGNSITATSFGLTFEWRNTASALAGATLPTSLFTLGTSTSIVVTCRGVDLSALGSGKNLVNYAANAYGFILFDSCKIDPAVGRVTGTATNSGTSVELINCYDGTNQINERYMPSGSVVTERTIVMSGGANDGALFSHKMVSSTSLDKFVAPLDGFWIDVYNAVTGVSQNATVEIISSGTLNNDDISLLLQYEPTSGSPVAGFVTTLPTILTTPSALPSSSVTWNASPATPVKQKLVVTFTAQQAGRLRGLVRLGKPSTTVYYNPQMQVA